jgi:hypothetical protein
MTPRHGPNGAVSRRDRVAWAICQFALNRIATSRYRRFVAGAILYGVRAATRDVRTGAPAPDHQFDPPRRVS